MRSILFSMFFISVITSKGNFHHRKTPHHHLAEILKSREIYFSKTKEYIHNAMNKMFKIMNLPERFTDNPKTKLLLTMHYDLANIAENTSKMYNELRNLTTVEVNNEAVKKIKLDELVTEILNEKQYNAHNISFDKKSKPVKRTHKKKGKFLDFNDSDEFNGFIRLLRNRINSLTVDDLIKLEENHSKSVDYSKNNLEIWEPPENLNLDWNLNNTVNRRIFRGKKTNVENFPFVVSIHILQEFTCAGSIISKDLVLTAASCVQVHYNNRFFRENPKTTYVRIGSNWQSRRGDLIAVLEIYFYPSYNPKTLKHNIALLRLERWIKFRRQKTKVRRIELDSKLGNLAANTREVVVLGWGARHANQIVDDMDKLMVSFLDVYHVDECKKIYSKEYVTENNFCAGFIAKGGGACNRDVGAPGVVSGVLAGIVSFGPPVCGAIDSPTVFTRVGPYLSWITPIMLNDPIRYAAQTTTPMHSSPFVNNVQFTKTTIRLLPITKTPMPNEDLIARAQQDSEERALVEIISDLDNKNESLVHDILNIELPDMRPNETISLIQETVTTTSPVLNISDNLELRMENNTAVDSAINSTHSTQNIGTTKATIVSPSNLSVASMRTIPVLRKMFPIDYNVDTVVLGDQNYEDVGRNLEKSKEDYSNDYPPMPSESELEKQAYFERAKKETTTDDYDW